MRLEGLKAIAMPAIAAKYILNAMVLHCAQTNKPEAD